MYPLRSCGASCSQCLHFDLSAAGCRLCTPLRSCATSCSQCLLCQPVRCRWPPVHPLLSCGASCSQCLLARPVSCLPQPFPVAVKACRHLLHCSLLAGLSGPCRRRCVRCALMPTNCTRHLCHGAAGAQTAEFAVSPSVALFLVACAHHSNRVLGVVSSLQTASHRAGTHERSCRDSKRMLSEPGRAGIDADNCVRRLGDATGTLPKCTHKIMVRIQPPACVRVSQEPWHCGHAAARMSLNQCKAAYAPVCPPWA